MPEPPVNNIEASDVGCQKVRTMNSSSIDPSHCFLLAGLVAELAPKKNRVLVCWPAP
jgi:hypothetical protein